MMAAAMAAATAPVISVTAAMAAASAPGVTAMLSVVVVAAAGVAPMDRDGVCRRGGGRWQ